MKRFQEIDLDINKMRFPAKYKPFHTFYSVCVQSLLLPIISMI